MAEDVTGYCGDIVALMAQDLSYDGLDGIVCPDFNMGHKTKRYIECSTVKG